MLRVTPRATVVLALARREAELLDQPACSGHVLVALIWEGGGVGAAALTAAGLARGSDQEIRGQLARASDEERGMSIMELQVLAGHLASELGHDYVGTEHQLLALTRDSGLGEQIISDEPRLAAARRCHELLNNSRAA